MPEAHPLPPPERGVIFALRLDGRGGAQPLAPSEALGAEPDAERPVWVHLDRNDEEARAWLTERSALPESVVDLLLADEPRPRALELGSGVALVLRGMNLNEQTDPENMLTLRGWFEPGRIVTVRIWRVMSVRAVRHALLDGRGPSATGEVLADLVDEVVSRITEATVDLETQAEELIDGLDGAPTPSQNDRLKQVSRRIVAIRRHVAPQREALPALLAVRAPWLGEGERTRLAHAVDRTRREVETLDAVREQIALTEQSATNAAAERLNRTTFALTIIATLFLPITFLTGMLGMNVGGIPLADSPRGFVLASIALTVLVALEGAAIWWVLRRR